MTSSQPTHYQSNSYSQDQRPIQGTTKPLIYIAKERRCLNFSAKEDRQPRNDLRCFSSPVTKQYGAYTASPAKKTTSAIIKVTIDKCIQILVNWWNIARDTTIIARPKNSSQNLNFSFLP